MQSSVVKQFAYITDSIQFVPESMGHLVSRRRASCDGNGLHNSKASRDASAQVQRHGQNHRFSSGENFHRAKSLHEKTFAFISQYKLFKNFGYTDNYVIDKLEASLVELRAKRMHLPPPGDENELPKSELGCFIEPTIEKKLGLRTACFTDSERNVTEFVISRNEENGNDVEALDENQGDDTISNLNTGN
jgi:hypothetical protein